ncbi:unnamed protein product [Linum tenue]|uniref:Uncharacterized protein n=1 Tax=Linum tenue TaxID=586396 RepID=A0AAV0QC37_9ROSI|nr:unnamed protein product [Linum tenue]
MLQLGTKTSILHGSLLLGSSLGDLGTSRILLLHGLDDTHSNGLPHVPHGEPTQRWVLGESLHHHGLGRNHLHEPSITILQELRLLLELLSRSPVDLGHDLRELHSNVGGVAVKHWGIAISNLARVVHDDDLGCEVGSLLGRVILGVGGNEPTLEILDSNILHVEPNVVTRESLLESFMVHLNRLDLSRQPGGTKGNNHTGLDDTGLNTTHWHSSNTTDLVHILKWETEWLV